MLAFAVSTILYMTALKGALTKRKRSYRKAFYFSTIPSEDRKSVSVGFHCFGTGTVLRNIYYQEIMTYPCIHKIISEKGYDGSVASLRMFIQKERIRCVTAQKEDACSDYQPKEYVQRRSLTQLIYKGLDDVKTISQEQYEQVLKSYPVIADLYVTIKEFYEIIYSKHEEKLDAWLVKLEKFNIPELQTYVNGIRQDIVAVKNGIAMQYNNGLAEGSVNKLKVIKRIMYGINSFELLKAKVLLHEQFRCEIN